MANNPLAGTYVANNIDALTGEHAIVYKAEKMFVINETVNDPLYPILFTQIQVMVKLYTAEK